MKIIKMRIFIPILILILSFQSLSRADDIKDFQIEGITIKDSLLNYFSIKEINNSEIQMYRIPEKFKYERIYLDNFNFKNFEYLAIDIKMNDNKYIIYGVTGMIDYKEKEECKIKQNEINNSIKSFISVDPDIITIDSEYDETGESKVHYISYKLNSGYIQVICHLFAEHTKIKSGLDLSIRTNEFQNWLNGVD